VEQIETAGDFPEAAVGAFHRESGLPSKAALRMSVTSSIRSRIMRRLGRPYGLKIPSGGWFPLIIGLAVFTIMTTWREGRRLVMARLASQAVPLASFLATCKEAPEARVSGTGSIPAPRQPKKLRCFCCSCCWCRRC
jgi:hypothetical protein